MQEIALITELFVGSDEMYDKTLQIVIYIYATTLAQF